MIYWTDIWKLLTFEPKRKPTNYFEEYLRAVTERDVLDEKLRASERQVAQLLAQIRVLRDV